MEFNKLNPKKPLTNTQKITLKYANELPDEFKTKDLARYIYPIYFFIGKAYVCKKDKTLWAKTPKMLKEIHGVVDFERYDFRRRAILTTSSRLKSLVSAGCIIQVKKGIDVFWKINFM